MMVHAPAIFGVLIPRYQGIDVLWRLFGMVFSAFQLGAAALGIARPALGSYPPVLAVLALIGGALFALFGPYRFVPGQRGSGRSGTVA